MTYRKKSLGEINDEGRYLCNISIGNHMISSAIW